MRHYNESEVINALSKKHDVFIPAESKEVRVLKGHSASNDIGIKSKGKIDFLLHYCGYILVFVTTFK